MTVLVIVFFMFAFLILVSLGTYALDDQIDKLEQKFSSQQPPSIGQKWNANLTLTLNCAEDEIALQNVHGIEPGCFPKAGLYETCKVKEQCTVKYSFCAFHFDVDDEDPPEEDSIEDSSEDSSSEEEEEFQHDSKVCKCNDGYTSNPDLTACLRTHPKCSLMASNPNYTQEDCPYAQQFCQYGTCLCAPGYTYNAEGLCVWFVPDHAEPNTRKIVINLKPVGSVLEPESIWNWFGHQEQMTFGIICLWIVSVGAMAALILGFLFCLKSIRNNNNQVDPIQAEQLNPLNPNQVIVVRDFD